MYPLGLLCCACGVLGGWAPALWCARSVCCVVCAVSLATWLMFTGVPTRYVALRVQCRCSLSSCSQECILSVLCVWCTWPIGSYSPVCLLGVLCSVCPVLGHLAPVHRCERSVCCVAAVLGHFAPVHRCACSVCCVVCAVSLATWLVCTNGHAWCAVCPVSLATWLLFTSVHARCVCVLCPWLLGSCSPMYPLNVFCPVCGVLGH